MFSILSEYCPLPQIVGYRSMCSKYDNEDACTSNCGQGADKGSCQWKNITDAMSSFAYATCSPNFDTCPDNECDELESKFVHICLQDCVGKSSLSNKTIYFLRRKNNVSFQTITCRP